MTTSTITNVAKDPSGTPVVGVAVIARLRPGRGFRVDDSSTIEEVRWSNVARYTGAYTPAGAPFTTDANTVLLVHCDTVS